MYDFAIPLFLALAVVGFSAIYLLDRFIGENKKQTSKGNGEILDANHEEYESASAKDFYEYKNPNASALQEAVRQSVKLNLAALEAQRQMNDLAYHYRQDASTPRNTDFQPEIVSVEFKPLEEWPRDRF